MTTLTQPGEREREREEIVSGRSAWSPEGTLLVEIRAGTGDLALVASLCGSCGVELQAEQTDIPRAAVAVNYLESDGRLQERLMASAVLRLKVRRCECGAALPGPRISSRIEIPEG